MSKGGSTNTVTKSDPWAQQQPYLTSGFQSAKDLYNPGGSGGPQYFGGSTYAPPTDLQNAGLSQVGNLGLNGTAAGNAASNADVQGINGSQGFFNNIASQVLPQIQGQFASGNRMDSGLATRAATSGLGSAWMNNQLNYMNQAPTLNNMQMQGAAGAATAGQEQQTNNQANINDQIQRFNYNQQLPYSNLNNYMNLIQGNYGGTSTASQPYFNNILGQLGAGAGGLAALYGSGIFGGGSAAAGAGAASIAPDLLAFA